MNIFLFHRDLRLFDNTSLIRQIKKFKQVTPVFIFHPPQIDPKKNSYFSHNSVQFMCECLEELRKEIKDLKGEMHFFYGQNMEVLKQINKQQKIRSIYYNYDYTPFAKARDAQIQKWGLSEGIQVCSFEDYTLYPILQGGTLSKNSGRPYLVFTPFKNFCLANLKISKPDNFVFKPDHFQHYPSLQKTKAFFNPQKMFNLYQLNKQIRVRGGRKNGLQILSKISNFKNYNKERNNPSIPTTTLSAYLHFTPISIRQVFAIVAQRLGYENNIVNQLHWRDFYVNITHYHPKVLQPPKNSFQQKFDQIKWKYNEHQLQAWKSGNTGFPIVDAAMRQLNTTGFMHNRCRMIVASFFARDLFLDWHEGERYFATKLVDYSPMQNSGGWQWTVGNGTDAQPYFRIFNPWSQQANYDPLCIYIKKWVPQLRFVDEKVIHSWSSVYSQYIKKGVKYPKPIIEHDKARKQALETYDKYFKKGKS